MEFIYEGERYRLNVGSVCVTMRNNVCVSHLGSYYKTCAEGWENIVKLSAL